MPTVVQNFQHWNSYSWPKGGEEWSAAWGTVQAQWAVSLLPRVGRFLPAQTILEIAPGHGRWTQYLASQCQRLILVDLSPNCIDVCRDRFADWRHIEYHVNDGRSLDMVPDSSLDFVFCMDSLVHAEPEVVGEYVWQLGRKLRPGGGGFIHHSNAGNYPYLRWKRGFLEKHPAWKPLLSRMGYDHWRSLRMTAGMMAGYCQNAGLEVLSQELIPWHRSGLPIDCFTAFRRSGSLRPAPEPIRNLRFMDEAKLARCLSMRYGGSEAAKAAAGGRD